MNVNRQWIIALGVAALLWFGLIPITNIIVDYLWFSAAQHPELFTTILSAKLAIGAAMFVISAGFIGFN